MSIKEFYDNADVSELNDEELDTFHGMKEMVFKTFRLNDFNILVNSLYLSLLRIFIDVYLLFIFVCYYFLICILFLYCGYRCLMRN